MMKKLFLTTVIFLNLGCNVINTQQCIDSVIDNALQVAVKQSRLMYAVMDTIPDRFPKTIGKNGALETCKSDFWISGFYPGQLWYLYEYTHKDEFKKMAESFTARVEKEKNNTENHDVGFMINCSFGHQYKLFRDSTSKKVLITAANSLATRFRETVGCTLSWSHPGTERWQFPVIIDNMMNMELLIRGSSLSGNIRLHEMAVSHANVTLKNHFRSDYSSYHVVSYDTITGNVESKNTAQGYSDSSAWSRGQAWGLYGYTMMYRETKDEKYLQQANHIAQFILSHPNMPEDKIPYWDFNDPQIPNTYRDASAGAIMASALIELSTFVDKRLKNKYLSVAEKQIRTLASDKYLAKVGENQHFILKHSVGFLPVNSEVDVPLSYADYYFIEAMIRFRNLKQTGKI